MTGTQHARFLARLWDLLAEPKSVTIMMTFAYAALLGMGFSSLAGASPGGLRDMMGGLLIVGGVCGLIG
ncbi:hypothetical protein, partial [Propionibacterium freudenreichii]